MHARVLSVCSCASNGQHPKFSCFVLQAQYEGYVAALLTREQDWKKLQQNVAKG